MKYLVRSSETKKSRDSSVGIATDYGLDDRMTGVRIPTGLGIFLFGTLPDRLWGPPSPVRSRY
jgi:hypothetical protein